MSAYQKGRKYMDQQCYESAKTCFRSGHDKGDPKCAYGLYAAAAAAGEDCGLYLEDLRAAISHLRKLADSGDREACFALGRCYETGSALEQDIHAAMKYYTKAAVQQDPDAQFNLGCIYMRLGPGGEKIAVDYFNQAAQQGSMEALAALKHYEQESKKKG